MNTTETITALEVPASIEHLNLTKSAIHKIIFWSTSRYNTMKKSSVVNEIFKAMKEGGVWIVHWKDTYSDKWQTRAIAPLMGKERIEYCVTLRQYSSGSYCECSTMTRAGTYTVNFSYKTIYHIESKTLYSFQT